MAYAAIEFRAQDSAGNFLTDVEVEVLQESPGFPSAGQLYSNRAGTDAIGNPATFADGVVRFFLPGGAYRVNVRQGGDLVDSLSYKAVGLLGESDELSASEVPFDDGNSPAVYSDVQSALAALFSAADSSLNAIIFGADPTGASDSSPALAAMLAAGTDIYFPPGRYVFNSTIEHIMPNSAGWATISTSSVAVGTGTKTFTVAAGLSISPGDNATVYDSETWANRMVGTVSSYSGTTLELSIASIVGSGTIDAWNIVENYQNTDAIASVSIGGGGPDVTELVWPSGAGIEFTFRSQQHSIHFRNLAMVTGAANDGNAITIVNEYPYFGTFAAGSTFDNIVFRGDDGYANVFHWTKDVAVVDCSNLKFSGCRFVGASTPAGTGVTAEATQGSYCTNIKFDGACLFHFLALGFRYGYKVQTVAFDHTFFGQNTNDIYVPADGGHLQGLTITGCEWYAAAAGDRIYMETALPDFVFMGNKMAVHAGYRGIALDEAEAFVIVGNTFFPDATPNTATSAIDVDGMVSGAIGVIDGNTFRGTTIGVRLLSGANDILFGPSNLATTGMTLVSDAGGSNGVQRLVLGAAASAIPGAFVYVGGSNRNLVYGLGSDGPLISAVNDANNAYVPFYFDVSKFLCRVGAFGYGTGAGGAITQNSNKSTAVTVDKPTGKITMNSATLNAATIVSFTFNNSHIAATDQVVVTHESGGTVGAYTVNGRATGAGTAEITVRNNTAGNLGEALVLRFSVTKSSDS